MNAPIQFQRCVPYMIEGDSIGISIARGWMADAKTGFQLDGQATLHQMLKELT